MARITFILKPLSPIAACKGALPLTTPLSARFPIPVMVHQYLSSHESMAKDVSFADAGTMSPRLRPCADESFSQKF